MSIMSLAFTPIHELHQKRLAKEITTEEIVQAVLQRIKDTNKELGVYLYLAKEEEVLNQAKAVDKKIMQGDAVGELEGMPLAIKDLFNIKGTPTTCASQMLKNYVAPYDSTVTTKLQEASYMMIGKTNMDEFAMGSSNENSSFFPVKNPYDLTKVPGGSSGGSAVAVSAGLSVGAIGTDTGGSIRQPASFNHIVGLKPTYGRVSRWGMTAFASSLDQAGPMTRDVEDAALLLEAIAGFDPKDATSLKVPVPSYKSALHKSIKGLKVGIIKEQAAYELPSDIRAVYDESLAFLKESGCEFVEVSVPNIKQSLAAYYIIAPAECSSNLGRYDGVHYGSRAQEAETLESIYELSREHGFGKEVKMRILLGTYVLSSGYYDAYYNKALQVQNLLRSQYAAIFKQVDVIVCPTAPSAPFDLNYKTDDPLFYFLQDVFTIPANLASIPAISLPAGLSKESLPVGIQFQANFLQEETLFQIAHFFEQHKQVATPSLQI